MMPSPRHVTFSCGWLWLLIAALLVALAYVYEVGVAGSGKRFQRLTAEGGPSDLYPYWLGGRLLLDQHQSPYTASATDQIERGYFGADYATARNTHDKQFAYPIYVTFLLYPILHLPFDLAAWIWSTLFLLLAGASLYWWCGLIGWPRSPLAPLALAILALGFYGVTNGFFLHQVTAALLPLLVLIYAAMRRGWYALAGVGLALFTVKPQLAVLLIPTLLLWSLFRWRERRNLLLGFVATMLGLELGSELLLRGWFGPFLDAVRQYVGYTGGDTLITALTGSGAANILLTVLLVALTTFFWWQAHHVAPADYPFLYAFCFSLVATELIIPTFALYNQAVFILPTALLIFARLSGGTQMWQRGLFALFALALGWDWLSGGLLGLLYLSGLAPDWVAANRQMPLQLGLYVPLLTLVALLAVAPGVAITTPQVAADAC